jgi:hypothetical protein
MTLYELLESRRDEIRRIAARHKANNVRVFGSVARNEAGPESDIDLLVSFEEGASLLDHAALIRELETALGCKVDVVSDRGLRDRIKERVLREAMPI